MSQSRLSTAVSRGYSNGHPTESLPPQIYSASYSGVDVYEMEFNNVAVMRRRYDSWLNATQILKVAGVEKGKRTKILEKEIQTGDHEKVQGGYGKYQGTWIAFNRGVEVCRQYGVEEALRPLLTYDMGQDGGIAGQGDLNTPTKEQALAAQRKRMYNSSMEARANGLSGTFFKNISSTASHAVAAISKARFGSPGPRSRGGPARASSFSRQPSMQDDFPTNSQQSYASEYVQADSAYSTQQQGQPSQAQPNQSSQRPLSQQSFSQQPPLAPDYEPPRKRQRITMTPADSFGGPGYGQNVDVYANSFPGSPTEPNESFIYAQGGIHGPSSGDDVNGSLAPLPYEMSPEMETKRSTLMSLFMEGNEPDEARLDMLATFTPAELDMPIDPQSHTALHWAATLSRMPLLRALIAAGASPCRVNTAGETPLMRACLVTNSMDHGSFPDLLEVLGGTIEARDHKGRTVLHHIAVTSAVKGRNAASRYYLESLLEWVVRQGSVPPNSHNTQGPSTLANPQIPKMGIARFMSEIVNLQDSSGDTALCIAARIGNRSVISQLIEVGADPMVENRWGLRPIDFGVGEKTGERSVAEATASAPAQTGAAGTSQKTRESSDEIIASISNLLSETGTTFQQEMKAKQTSLDSLHASIRTTSAQVAEARRQLESLSATVKKQQVARQQVSNLAHAREEEQLRLMRSQSTSSTSPAAAATAGSGSANNNNSNHQYPPPPSSSWETELGAMLESTADGAEALLPSGGILRARIKAVEGRQEVTRKMVSALQGRSRDVEVKYKRVVALCTGVREDEVDAVIEGLLKAVESEGEALDIDRVRRFLTGVEAGGA